MRNVLFILVNARKRTQQIYILENYLWKLNSHIITKIKEITQQIGNVNHVQNRTLV